SSLFNFLHYLHLMNPTKYDVLKRYLRSMWRINKEESEKDTRNEIMSEVSFKGANLWLLGFTMIIACVGLNMNSSYAIIGAMLMSPLMAPVIGMGFSISTNNWKMFKTCAHNWVLSFAISLAASTIYFYITPFSEATEALKSFSHPTIYDILLAFFGGLAAFIGITRLRGIKVLAGVAVATACMPPLSTAGYGLAHLHMNYFLGGTYFYIINCIYIGLAVMLLSKYMNFTKFVSFKAKPLSAKIVYILAFISLLPATYFAWQLVEEKKTATHINNFVNDNLNNDNMTVLKKYILLDKSPKEIDVFVAGNVLSVAGEDSLSKKLNAYGLGNFKLIIHVTPDLEAIQAEPDLLKQLILKQEKKLNKQDTLINFLSKRMDSLETKK
ncbi:MAG: DUF389 domain-containing protein, partial [Ginsengibacter sp.]